MTYDRANIEISPSAPEENCALLELLESYEPSSLVDSQHRDFIHHFVSTRSKPFSRLHLDGHLTGSALVVNESASHVLLGYHRKLQMWLQFGGHGEDGECDPEEVALREAREESGITGLRRFPRSPAPYDLDVHRIPAFADTGSHLHLDIRFLALAPQGAVTRPQVEEQEKVRWFTWEEAACLEIDDSLRRMLHKAVAIVRS